MSTANQTISRRDTSDIETLLAAVFRSQPASATLAEIDRRVAAALDTWTPMPTGFVDRFARSRRRMVLLGVAGFLLVGAGGVSLIGTYESFWGGGFGRHGTGRRRSTNRLSSIATE